MFKNKNKKQKHLNLIFNKLSLLGRIFIVKKMHVVPWNNKNNKSLLFIQLRKTYRKNIYCEKQIQINPSNLT